MQNDEIIWQVINHHFCSFKSKVAKEKTFCRNEDNVSGLCNKSSCPLANSRYATIKEEDGLCYLYIKTIERAHTPKNMWEKIKLPRNYEKALAIVSKELEYFPKFLAHKNKQRLTKIHQYLIRMRRLRLTVRPKIVGVNKKLDKRERTRERKALQAAQVEKAIEQELLNRLKEGTYGDIYNFPQRNYNKALDEAGAIEDEDDLEVEDEEDDGQVTRAYVEDFSDSDVSDMEDFYSDESDESSSDGIPDDEDDSSDDGESDSEGAQDRKKSAGDEDEEDVGDADKPSNKRRAPKRGGSKPKKKRPKKKRSYVEVEYEQETEKNTPLASASMSW
jgi:protein MAK16|eukprot:g642.t1